MKKYILTVLVFIYSVFFAISQDTLYFQNFEDGFGDIIVYDLDSLFSNPATDAPGHWAVTDTFYTNSKAAISSSWYYPPGQSDDWMILPKLSIADSSTLSWVGRSFYPTYEDSYEIRVSTTDSLPTSFDDLILFVDLESTVDTLRSVSLDNFAGDSIFIAFRNVSFDRDLLIIDNILVDGIISGCTDINSCNYNSNASVDDGSCSSFDCIGECGGTATEGTMCDDENELTINDAFDSDCICSGEIINSIFNNKDEINQLIINPNKVENNTQLTLPKAMQVISIELYNFKGQLVKEETPQGIKQHFILDNLSVLPKGVYHLIVKTNEGNFTSKLMR